MNRFESGFGACIRKNKRPHLRPFVLMTMGFISSVAGFPELLVRSMPVAVDNLFSMPFPAGLRCWFRLLQISQQVRLAWPCCPFPVLWFCLFRLRPCFPDGVPDRLHAHAGLVG